jgi:hypothetical protein
VIALQVHGRKSWQSFGIPVPHPIEQPSRSVADGRKAEWEDTLGPGDVLYLPRGEIHVAELGDVNSVHLTIGLSPRRGLDFAETIVKQAAEDAIFRQDIPSAGGEAALAEYEAALKKSLHALVDRTRLSDFLDRDSSRRPLRPLANLGGGGDPFDANTLVIPAVRRRITLDVESEEAIDVTIARETFRLSAPARRVLDFLLTHNDSTLGAIVSALARHLSEPLAQDAVMELAKHGLVGVRA